MKTAFVLGGYGLIGARCVRALKGAGFRVVGVGRSMTAGRRSDPGIDWIACNIARAEASDWARDLRGADVVVNAAGALQDGLRDDLTGIHETAIAQLVKGLAGSRARIIQISAARARVDAPTEFLRSKARGDALLMGSSCDWVVLRPVLAIGAEAYGGTALLRALAAFPLIEPRTLPEARIQTVTVDDIAAAVVVAATGAIASRTLADLTEDGGQSLSELTRAIRAWQGFAPWRASIPVPRALLRAVGLGADALGWLGWRAPLRSAALRTLRDGVTGDPGPWLAAGGAPMRSLAEMLAALPATMQERWFARMFLLLPLAVGGLAAFWTLSGAIGLARVDAAAAVLTDRGFADGMARALVIGGSFADLALGVAVLVRPWARGACLGMVALSLGYMGGAAIWAPDLWVDPLGPMVKVAPGILAALLTAAMLEDR
ncbi:MAG: hypothetical protein ACJA1L_002578 [Paracoccaceae bacterium]|jgi:uncharacterized protein YbjT (DUF2867 family)